jgi:hypothetical protein
MENEAKKIEEFEEHNLKAPIDFIASDKLAAEDLHKQFEIPSIKYKERPKNKGKAVEVKLNRKQKATNNLF